MNYSFKLSALVCTFALTASSVMCNQTNVMIQPADGTTQVDVRTSEVPWYELPEYKTPYAVRKTKVTNDNGWVALFMHGYIDALATILKDAARSPYSDPAFANFNSSINPLVHMAHWGTLAAAVAFFAKNVLAETANDVTLTEEDTDSIRSNKTWSLVGLAATAGVIAYKCLAAAGMVPHVTAAV